MPGLDKTDIMRRAMAAWFRGGETAQPSATASGLVEHETLNYVVLRNVRGLLAVYRVTNAGQLKRLKRWPKVFGESE